ncbi:hypothetical protein D3C73_1091350 [compost metagenome]
MVFAEIPPSAPRVASERINTLGLLNWLAILMRSPSKEPKLNGEVGSMANMAMRFPAVVKWLVMAFTKVLLPAPGGPVIPKTGTLT